MSDHDVSTDELVALLRGELGRGRFGEVLTHLRGCAACRLALVDVTQVHGTLEAARRLLQPVEDDEPVDQAGADATLPLLRLPHRRRVPRRVAAASAAALTAAALTAGVVVVQRAGGPDPTQVASVELRPVTGAGAGRVTMSGPGSETDMTISTRGLPAAGDGRFYYAWLLDPVTQKMLPLGLVGAGTATHFAVATDLVHRYHAVDISLQDDDGDPAHSATSVLRATY